MVEEEDADDVFNFDGRNTVVDNLLKDENVQDDNLPELSPQIEEPKKPIPSEEKPVSSEQISQPSLVEKPIESETIKQKPKKKKKEVDRNKKIKEVIEEDKCDKIISYFKKIINPEIPDIKQDGYDKNYGLFHCGKKNEANGSICELGKDLCPNCMKKTQEMYHLKPHYLINSNGRICTYKKNKIYCLGKLTRVESEFKSKENKQIGINYSISYTFGHTGQCEPCKNLTNIMDKYFGASLMQKLKKRDETSLN